jgi:DNA-binding NarL/FixJ family response regulator
MNMAGDEAKTRARVLIVDDHPAVREALAIRIAQTPDLELCGQAADMAEALRLVDDLKPDIAVVDISLKTGDGIDLIKRVRKHNEHVRTLVWSMYGEEIYAERALRAGADGYITKEHATADIVAAIRDVLEGKLYLSQATGEKLLKRVVGRRRKSGQRSAIDTLSDRELEVLRLIGEGVKTDEIAAQLHLSVHTVSTYRDRIRDKLQLRDAVDLVRYATRWVMEQG